MVAPLPGLGALAPPPPFDTAFFAVVLALCALGVVLPRRAVFAALFFAFLLLALPDMMRWQPWAYLYLAAIGTLAFVPASGAAAPRPLARIEPLGVLRILVASVYIYSGLNKLNATFMAERLSGFLAGLPPVLSDGAVVAGLTYSAPFLEMAAGFGLLAGGIRIRHGALLLAASTNLFVLAALVPTAANTVVWPWNLAMICLVIALYAGRDRKPQGEPQEAPRSATRAHTLARGAQGSALWRYCYAGVVVVLFAIIPLLGIAGYWPSYLSFALYSENTSEATVATKEGSTSVTQMSYESLNVPAYPSPAVYKQLGERACAAGHTGPVLVVQGRPDILDGSQARQGFSCTAEGLRADPRGSAARSASSAS